MLSPAQFLVPCLGDCRFASPLRLQSVPDDASGGFTDDQVRVLLETLVRPGNQTADTCTLELAGPRRQLFFEPHGVTAAIVTCGGLSPGLNNVIRSAYCELARNYGVKRVLGIRNGYQGLNPDEGLEPIELTSSLVDSIDRRGGTVLGSSRGPQPPAVMADFLRDRGIDVLLCVGGDGTQRGAHALSEELLRRKSPIAVVGIPKTIDNDIAFVRLSFGYATALEKAAEAIASAEVEARGAINGIGLVKLMGRHAGMIAAGATIVSQVVDFTLIPEIPFPLQGHNGLLEALTHRLRDQGHAVIVVAEGAGQHLLKETAERRDASGNRLHEDIGVFLRDTISRHFRDNNAPVSIKYIDPSYLIRSVPASVYDRFLCDQMARSAVHAALAGKTGVMIGALSDHLVHVPIPAVVARTKNVDVAGELWRAVLQTTGQPIW